MARRVSYNYHCDNVDRHGFDYENRPEGDTLLVYSPQRQKVVEIDLCSVELEGGKRLSVTEVVDLADRFGREITEPGDVEDLTCPHGCRNGKPYKSLTGKRRHMLSAHDEAA